MARALVHPISFAAALLVAFLIIAGCRKEVTPPPVASAAQTKPASLPATTQAATMPATYMDVLHAVYPTLPTTQPLVVAVAIKEAARFILNDPVYLDEHLDLWITRDDGPLTEKTIHDARSATGNEHILQDRVLFIWWVPDRGGEWLPRVIAPASGDGAQIVSTLNRQSIGIRRDYRWDRARSWSDGQDQRMIVPTAGGISVFTLSGPREPIIEAFVDLTNLAHPAAATMPAASSQPSESSATADISRAAADASGAEPQYQFDPRGIIAWIPPEKDQARGSAGAAHYENGAWHVLPQSSGWPDRIIHLIPLRDGSVTQMIAAGEGMKFAFTNLDATSVDQKAVRELVNQLGDDDSKVRESAYKQLADFGPGVWPILRQISEKEVPQGARARLRRLLRDQAAPMLGGMIVGGETLRLVKRLRDGGVILYAPDGVLVPDPQGDEPEQQSPAWLAARPGRSVELLPTALLEGLTPEHAGLDVINGQWVATPDAAGPRLFLGNSFRKLLKKDDLAFTEMVGLDSRGRWIFRKPVSRSASHPATSTSGPSNARLAAIQTLIIDPTIPDFIPHLPAWVYDNAEEVGWDKNDWPAVRVGELHMRLSEEAWVPLSETDSMVSTPPGTQPAPEPMAGPTSRAVAPPSTERAGSWGPPLLIDEDGNRYYGGMENLRVVKTSGEEIVWPLPADAAGTSAPSLLKTKDGTLYLFNQPGRVLRIGRTATASKPFSIEATFTRDIPKDQTPKRIWLDPAGRIIMAMDRSLVILFPSGYIPAPIREKMTIPEDEEN